MPQECEVKDSKQNQRNAALYPSSSIGRFSPDYVIWAVAKKKWEQKIELASKNCRNDKCCRAIGEPLNPLTAGTLITVQPHELDVHDQDSKKGKSS